MKLNLHVMRDKSNGDNDRLRLKINELCLSILKEHQVELPTHGMHSARREGMTYLLDSPDGINIIIDYLTSEHQLNVAIWQWELHGKIFAQGIDFEENAEFTKFMML